MPRFRRLVVPEYPHHVTQRGVRRQTTFFDTADYQFYLRLAKGLLELWPVEIWAYCLMPNHIHAIVVPGQQDSLSRFFSSLHQRYAWRTNSRHEWRGHLWQKRFYSVVLDEAHAVSAMRYVELNPVRAGLCGRPEDWPWSSARGNLGLAADPLLDRSRAQDLITDWGDYLAGQEDPERLNRLRRQTGTGRPDGEAPFIESLESLSGRRIQKRHPGRK